VHPTPLTFLQTPAFFSRGEVESHHKRAVETVGAPISATTGMSARQPGYREQGCNGCSTCAAAPAWWPSPSPQPLPLPMGERKGNVGCGVNVAPPTRHAQRQALRARQRERATDGGTKRWPPNAVAAQARYVPNKKSGFLITLLEPQNLRFSIRLLVKTQLAVVRYHIISVV
jgi:hypothetical protein